MRRAKFKRLRRILGDSLITTKPVFAAALREAMPQMQAILQVPMVSWAADSNVTITEFADLQSATREQQAKPRLQGIIDTIRKVGHRKKHLHMQATSLYSSWHGFVQPPD